MALITELVELKKDAPKVHAPAEATFTVFRDKNGNSYLQIDSYGSKTRQIPGKTSQSIQFGPDGLRALLALLASHQLKPR